MTALKRRWLLLAFGTLTMFAVVSTTLCCWMVYQLNWIHTRHAVLEQDNLKFRETGGGVFPNPSTEPPWPLALFGEKPIHTDALLVPPTAPEKELDRLRALFPELEIVRGRPEEF